MLRVGFSSVDQNKKWLGGRYYLHNIIRCNQLLESDRRLDIKDLYWQNKPDPDHDDFEEVRKLIGPPVTIVPPKNPVSRASRKLRNLVRGTKGAKDLFQQCRVDCLFPVAPCENHYTPYVFWLPDFQYLRRPDLLSPKLVDWLRTYFSEQVAKSDVVVLSSYDALNDFNEVFPSHASKSAVLQFVSVPNDEWWQRKPEDVSRQYNLPTRYMIACNQFTKHKNYPFLLEVIERLTGIEPAFGLVCTGGVFDHRAEDHFETLRRMVTEKGLSDRVKLLGMVPRSDQIALIRNAVAVLQPSMFEGWSTVIEDARALGKTVIASNLAVNAEQLGAKYQYLLLTDEPDSWAESISKVLSEVTITHNLELEKNALVENLRRQRECGKTFEMIIRRAVSG